jgi:DNA-binding MarR family transcriptional regulator
MTTLTDEAAEAFITASRALVGMAIRSIDRAAGPITVAQHRVLVILAARGPQTISDIAAELVVNPSNATRHCERLHQLGFVTKQRSRSDGRLVEVGLTAAGRRLLDAVTQARRREVAQVLEQLTSEQVETMTTALAAFSEAACETKDHDWATTPW